MRMMEVVVMMMVVGHDRVIGQGRWFCFHIRVIKQLDATSNKYIVEGRAQRRRRKKGRAIVYEMRKRGASG